MVLGIDLETEILSWLPAKSLMRFRCVRKSWNIRFQTPIFIKKWHMNMNMHDRDDDSLMILYETKPYVTLLSRDNLIHTKSLFSNHHHDIEIKSHGSCNGVFCLRCSCCLHKICFDELIMWNPTTGEVHRIPPTPSLNEDTCFRCLYGFGADDDSINTNFKVVKLQTRYGGTTPETTAEIYSLSTKSWISIQYPPHFTMITWERTSKYNTLVNGVYHWITNFPNAYVYYNGANILCFDFHNNQFQQLIGPTITVDYLFHWDDVAEIKGSLAYVANVLHFHTSTLYLKIWVRNQSGWDKKYNIECDGGLHICGLWKNGTQLLGGYDGKLLISYDLQCKILCKFQFVCVDYTRLWVYEYVPSIAPLART